MNIIKHKPRDIYNNSILFIVAFLLINTSCLSGQIVPNPHRIYFISDIQTPLPAEKIILKAYRNEEARDSLFSDLISQHAENLFLLGDMVSRGSKEKAWTPLEAFLNSLNSIKTRVYALPGNHEYMGMSSSGNRIFNRLFNEKWLHGFSVSIDSIAIVMLNSNFNKLTGNELSKQISWYKSEMDSLDADPAIKAIIVCTHHPPYSNSKIVGSSKPVSDLIVPIFEKSEKAELFISGHSHNLEYFSDSYGKHYLIIGGGGGIEQPLIPADKRQYYDLINQDLKPIYFYLIIENKGGYLNLIARGFQKDFKFFDLKIGEIKTD